MVIFILERISLLCDLCHSHFNVLTKPGYGISYRQSHCPQIATMCLIGRNGT